jgi:hypothetical protein
MKRVKKGQSTDLLAPSLEPVKHLSSNFQRKLIKRADKQSKRFRSSGNAFPVVNIDLPYLDTETLFVRDPVAEKNYMQDLSSQQGHVLRSTLLEILLQLD